MESNHKPYNFESSRTRIDSYLTTGDAQFEEVNEIPSRDKLTYGNGFYVQHCCALFVDIRNSSNLPNVYKRPRLARIYRSYISEVVAIINSNINCREVNIVGDAVSGVFNTPYKPDIDSVFSTAAEVNSIIAVLNCKLNKYGIEPITIGIGIDYGRLLMVQAGYSGSGVSDVVWMGHAVNNASKLCHHGNQTYNDKTLMISSVVYENLSDENKKLMYQNTYRGCYHGNIVKTHMESWVTENCG